MRAPGGGRPNGPMGERLEEPHDLCDHLGVITIGRAEEDEAALGALCLEWLG